MIKVNMDERKIWAIGMGVCVWSIAVVEGLRNQRLRSFAAKLQTSASGPTNLRLAFFFFKLYFLLFHLSFLLNLSLSLSFLKCKSCAERMKG